MAPNPYSAIVGGTLPSHESGPDQGIDFTGQGPVYAAGSGTITAIRRGNAGFNDGLPGGGNELVYSIPSLGKYVYIAEDFIIRNGLKVGDTIKKGEVLGNVNSSWPGIETGFSTPSGSPLEPLLPRGSQYPASGQGAQFDQFVRNLGSFGSGVTGVAGDPRHPQPVNTHDPISGTANAVGSVVKTVAGIPGDVASVGSFLGRLTDPNLWIRILEIVGGSIVALAGLVLLVKNVGLGVPTAEIPQVAQTTASLVEKPTSELSPSSLRRLERETRP